MSRPSDEDVAEQRTLPQGEDSFSDVRGLDPAIAGFVRELGRAPTSGDPPGDPVLGIGTRIAEHFQVLRHLGSGGMGTVVLARDLRLDREVAIKLVGAATSRQAATRLQREAQAMARLSHPNVVAVHEVGTIAARDDVGHGVNVYIAMEYVDGGTARHWLKQAPRSWTEILDVYLQAGRGLAAAHAAGFVHRDFKPDNVLVGRDGRTRVADFGLARSWLGTDSGAIAEGTISISGEHPALAQPNLTATDAIVGTPGYMAPEQFANRDVGPAVDQFAFAVALYEALYGERPYGPHAALPVEELVLRPAPPERRVPAWLRRALVRALAPLPEARFVDMSALVVVLERGRSRGARRRRLALVLGGATLVATVGLGVGRGLGTNLCEDIAAPADAIWSDARAAEIDSAIARVDASEGPTGWDGLEPRVARWIEDWSAARRDTCVATRVDGSRSDALFDRSLACLDDRLHEVDAWLRLLERADAAAVRAIAERDVLPTLAVCNDTAFLLRQVDRPTDPDLAVRVDEIGTQLIDAGVLKRVGNVVRARALLEELRAPVEATGYPPLRARWLHARGSLALGHSEFADAERDLHEAYVLARTTGDDALAAQAALDLAFLHGVHRREIAVANVWLDHVRIDLARNAATPELAVMAANIEVVMADHEGRYDDAIAHGRHAVELADAELGPLSRLEARKELASALDVAGRPTEAIELYEGILADLEELQGPQSSSLQVLLTNLGLAYYAVGRNAEAIAMHRRALAIATRRVGADHVDLWVPELNLGLSLGSDGQLDEAATHLEHSRELVERLAPEFRADRALVLSSLAWLQEKRGHTAEALAIYLEALPLHRSALGPHHPELALQLTRTAEIMVLLAHLDDAEALLDEALAIWAEPTHAGNAQRTETWLAIAKLEKARGRPDAARKRLDDLLALAATTEVAPHIVADAKALRDALPRE